MLVGLVFQHEASYDGRRRLQVRATELGLLYKNKARALSTLGISWSQVLCLLVPPCAAAIVQKRDWIPFPCSWKWLLHMLGGWLFVVTGGFPFFLTFG